MFQTTATATIEVMYGKKAAVRKKPTPAQLAVEQQRQAERGDQGQRDVARA